VEEGNGESRLPKEIKMGAFEGAQKKRTEKGSGENQL